MGHRNTALAAILLSGCTVISGAGDYEVDPSAVVRDLDYTFINMIAHAGDAQRPDVQSGFLDVAVVDETNLLQARARIILPPAMGAEYADEQIVMHNALIAGAQRLPLGGREALFPGFVPAYIRPLFCEGKGPFRWAALSGDPNDIAVTDELIMNMFPENKGMLRWMKMAKEKIAFQGLPARICWLGQGEREKAGLAFNELVRTGKVKAPIVIGRDHLDTGSVASPNRETEAMLDGSDAVADWPILNALVNTAGGASWVSLHHGGGVGMGYSIHAGMVIVADGSDDAAARLSRVLRNDPGIGVIRHADAGYTTAQETSKVYNLDIADRLK